MQQVFDFLAGKISPEDFKKIWYSNEKLRNRINFYLALCGETCGGAEVEQVINDIILEHPESLGKSKRIKMAKQRIKEVFRSPMKEIYTNMNLWM
ncbi:MAG: hypothetical protein IJS71_03045 [Clostridia bacterium]|nr:hypothetical protein [Clostridia bacterium]